MLAGTALPAQAAFVAPYTANCSGDSIIGGGASFQNLLHNDASVGGIVGFSNTITLSAPQVATTALVNPYCNASSLFVTNSKSITYNSIGSGAGKKRFSSDGNTTNPYRGSLTGTTSRFIAYDEAPSATELANINEGDPSITTDNGVLRTVPVAMGADAMIVNVPDGCKWAASVDWKRDNTNLTTRFKLSAVQIENLWHGEYATWADLFGAGGFIARPGNSQGETDATCALKPIKRVVRQGASGTTYGFKMYLDQANPARSPRWDENQSGGYSNTTWPTGNAAAVINTKAAGGNISSNGDLADRVNVTDGSFGYGDLATARSKGFTMDTTTAGGVPDTTFWIPVPTLDANKYFDPQASGFGYKNWTNGITAPLGATDPSYKKGAKCAAATLSNVPSVGGTPVDSTTGSWAATYAPATGSAYPICLVTYLGLFDDNADVFGNTSPEQAKARSVKDYANYLLGNGQKLLLASDYSPISSTVKTTYSKPAVAAVDWNKP